MGRYKKINQVNNLGIIQARTGSSRLANKMLLNLGDYKLIEWVIQRSTKSTTIDKLILATTEKKSDDILCQIAKDNNLDVFRGSEENVLERFYKASSIFKPNYITRICADNPFISSIEIDSLYNYFIKKNLDYSCNHQERNNNGYPDGFGAEILCYKTLNISYKQAKTQQQQEHVTKYIYENTKQFKIDYMQARKSIKNPNLKFDIDTNEDYIYLKNLIKEGVKINSSPDEIVTIANKLNKID